MKMEGLKDYITGERGGKTDSRRITIEKNIHGGQRGF
jgi:hypothetical protein